jgi:hypothetical protein
MVTKKITLNELRNLVTEVVGKENNIKEYFGSDDSFVKLTDKNLNLAAVLDGLSLLRANRPELFHKYFPNIYGK